MMASTWNKWYDTCFKCMPSFYYIHCSETWHWCEWHAFHCRRPLKFFSSILFIFRCSNHCPCLGTNIKEFSPITNVFVNFEPIMKISLVGTTLIFYLRLCCIVISPETVESSSYLMCSHNCGSEGALRSNFKIFSWNGLTFFWGTKLAEPSEYAWSTT